VEEEDLAEEEAVGVEPTTVQMEPILIQNMDALEILCI
jgi:hypothetical protein